LHHITTNAQTQPENFQETLLISMISRSVRHPVMFSQLCYDFKYCKIIENTILLVNMDTTLVILFNLKRYWNFPRCVHHDTIISVNVYY